LNVRRVFLELSTWQKKNLLYVSRLTNNDNIVGITFSYFLNVCTGCILIEMLLTISLLVSVSVLNEPTA